MEAVANLFKRISQRSKGEFATNSLFSFSLKTTGLGLSYIFTLLLSRLYGAEELGRFSITFTVLNIFTLFFALGIPDAIVKIASNKNINRSYYYRRRTLFLTGTSAIIGGFILFLFSGPLAIFYKDTSLEDYFSIAALTIPTLIMLRLNYETLRGRNQIVKFGVLAFILPYFISCLAVVMSFYGLVSFNTDATIVFYSLGVFMALLISFFWIKTKESIEEAKTIIKKQYPVKKLLDLSLPMLATSSFIFIMGWTDTLMLGYYKSKSDVGIYSVVIKIARIAIIVITSINLVLAPKISEFYGKGEINKMKQLITNSTKYIFFFTFPLVLFVLLFNQFILSLFGDEFVSGSTALIIIMASQLFNAFCGSVGQVMNMTGTHKKLRNFTFISALFNITLNFILIPLYGIYGAAIATAISSVLLNLICVIFVKTKLGIKTYYVPFYKG